MLTFAPPIPPNLEKKLEVAVKRFQLEYDSLTLADARRLLARYDYKVPVLAAFQRYGNGALKEVMLRENLKRRKPREGWIATDLTVFGYPATGRRELWTPFIRSIIAEQALKCREAGLYQTDKLSNEELDRLLRQLPVTDFGSLGVKDASLFMLRKMAKMEREARENESAHQALQRLSRPLPQTFVDEMSREKEDALRWLRETSAAFYHPALNYDIDLFSSEDHIVLAYRDHQHRY
tara:strand:- start:10765 stop:11472 length:708 start_codon:yes stop_codon:yes gene_type:complete